MIRTAHDMNANALYMHVTDLPVARTEQLDAGTLVDLAEDDVVVGIEVIAPARSWPVAEVIERFKLSDDDVAMLRIMFPNATAVGDTRTATAETRQTWSGLELASA